MKAFACGAVVPGCTATFLAGSVDELLAQVNLHAQDAHGMGSLPPSILEQVRLAIRDTGPGSDN